MTSLGAYPWPYYADLQRRNKNLLRIGGYAWGIERAQDFLLDAIATDSVPCDPDELVAILNRIISSEARLNRSRAATLVKFTPVAEPASADDPAAEARIELTRIVRIVSTSDRNLLMDAGLGYADREIAHRRNSTPGAVRARLSRLRFKLVA